MTNRSPNYRLIKIHKSYTAGELADVLRVHRQTVRRWTKEGLCPIDSQKPMLIQGRHAAEFLKTRKAKKKRHCKLDELYCVKCRTPKKPADALADLEIINHKIGNLVGICPDCFCLMNKRVSLGKISALIAVLDVSIPQEVRHIVDSLKPSVNVHLNEGEKNYEKAQS